MEIEIEVERRDTRQLEIVTWLTGELMQCSADRFVEGHDCLLYKARSLMMIVDCIYVYVHL